MNTRQILFFFLFFGLIGCQSEEDVYQEKPLGILYNEGYTSLLSRDYEAAAASFEDVERQHAYSIWARQAQLMAAFSYYQSFDYDNALAVLERFIQLHPGSPHVAYAYYLRAICYYEQISDVLRDQSQTLRAHNAFNEVIRRFPESEYAKDARIKRLLTTDHLAGKEMEIGRFYLKKRFYQAAINRFRIVVDQYQTTAHIPEALYRLTEAYLALKLDSEAVRHARILEYNYPETLWSALGMDLIETYR